MEFKIVKAAPDDAEEILALYQSLVGTEGCTWTRDYPEMIDVNEDIESDWLYEVRNEKGEIVAAAACHDRNELGELDCWDKLVKKPRELSRIGVKPDMQGKGIAAYLLRHIENAEKESGCDDIRFLVSGGNVKALRLYKSFGYKRVGDAHMYDKDWYCYEKRL